MKIEIEIPKEFERDFTSDKFVDFFKRVIADIDCNGACGKYEKEIAEMFIMVLKNGIINNQPQVQLIDADYIIKQIEEQTSFLKDCTKYGNKDSKQQHKSYSTMMMYEVADLVDDLIEIIRQSGKKVP